MEVIKELLSSLTALYQVLDLFPDILKWIMGIMLTFSGLLIAIFAGPSYFDGSFIKSIGYRVFALILVFAFWYGYFVKEVFTDGANFSAFKTWLATSPGNVWEVVSNPWSIGIGIFLALGVIGHFVEENNKSKSNYEDQGGASPSEINSIVAEAKRKDRQRFR